MSAQITEEHLRRPAYIYVRQSTLAQVRHHRESTERQYDLRKKALDLGWREPLIRTLDCDLGQSGAEMTGREDFKKLVADVSMGEVGAVFALEVSRLARSNLDWQKLLRVCAVTATLVIDEDGCYDPKDFNDGLLLDLKGSMAQAELHLLRGRLAGGKLNKAKKGELRTPLPVGYAYDDQGHVVLDPDEQVRGAIAMVFRLFGETGSAYGVVRRWAMEGLLFPKRAYGGAWDGKLEWGHPQHGRILALLKNPCYAGTYVFGRYQYRRQITPDGEVHQHMQRMPMEEWRVNIPAHHVGYITWEQYLENQERLAKNRTNGHSTVPTGPAREGLALLHGMLLCGKCGRALTVRYMGNGGIYPVYDCGWLRRDGLATTNCMTIRCDVLDKAVAADVLKALQPVELELAVAALDELAARDKGILRQWQMRLERAQYEASLAERRYQEVDPSQRLVAATLEQRWNDSLLALDDLQKQYDEFVHKEARALTPEQKLRVMSLAKDLPRLWNAPTTQARDRKRMLRLLIKDITVEKAPGAHQALLHVRWQGGACTDIPVDLPLPVADRVRYPDEVIERVRELATDMHDKEIAIQLSKDGRVSAKGKPYSVPIVKWIRWRYKIPAAPVRSSDELTVKQVADRFGVSTHVVYYWIDRGVLEARQSARNLPYSITLDAAKSRELRKWVKESTKLRKSKPSNR